MNRDQAAPTERESEIRNKREAYRGTGLEFGGQEGSMHRRVIFFFPPNPPGNFTPDGIARGGKMAVYIT